MIRYSVFAWSFLLLAAYSAPSWCQGARNSGPLAPENVFRADLNEDGKLSLEELRGRFPNFSEERFSRMDRNKNGFLSRDEFQGHGRADGRALLTKAIEQLLKTDAGKDGEVTYAELSILKPGYPRDVFTRLDVNRDAVLSLLDLRAIKLLPAAGPRIGRQDVERLRRNLMRADANRDGEITYEEAVEQFPNLPVAMFNRLDRNNDGVLSRDDRRVQR